MLRPVGLSVWVLLVCFSGATGKLNCEHCLYGPEYCHEDTNQCLYGCIVGWTGDDCNINCTIPKCIDCELTPLGQECRRCKNGFYGKYCNISCSFFCKYGETHCDREGKCNYGCEHGWVGDLCNRRECIIPNCQSCEEWSNGQPSCKLCEVGYYWDGSVCGECSPHCVGGRNSCNTSTGACLNGCMDNWIGANCGLQCNFDHCLQCSTALGPYRAVCTQCQSGYFLQDGTCARCGHCKNGETCDNINGTCPNGCADWFQGDKCNIFCDILNCKKCKASDFNRTVCELCESGYYYSSPDSCQPCNFNCGGGPEKCDPRTGKCTTGCLVGYYGEYCNYICSQHCINNTCISIDGNCDCEEGWFGWRCDRQCPVNCDECDGFAVSNTCSRCQQGWYGPHCEIACPENCLQEPYRDRCDKVTGQCNMGCYGSMYGKFCNKTCSPNCIGKCDQLSGNCSNGCVSAWYGPACEQKCSSSCKDASPGFRICDRDNGTCYFGCENGKYGQTCDKICSYKCRNRTCVMTSGDCVVCMKGFYGMNCSQQCEGHCMESECDQLSGICTQGCTPGYFGIKCDQVCSQSCIDYKCDKNTGFCVKGCIDGFYGNTCNQICNTNCLNNTCQQTTGTCYQGCKSGYMGALCVQGCSSGFYGENCEKSCGQCVNDSPCLPTSGKCPQGCALGWGKDTCDSKLQYGGTMEETTSLPITIQAGISAAGVIFLLFLGVVIFIVYKRRHHKHVKKERDSMTVTYSVVFSDERYEFDLKQTVEAEMKSNDLHELLALVQSENGHLLPDDGDVLDIDSDDDLCVHGLSDELDSRPLYPSTAVSDGYSSQAVIPTNGSDHFDSNAGRKVSLNHVHISHNITQVDMAPTISSQSVDRSQQSGINISDSDGNKSEDKIHGSSSAPPSKDADSSIDVVDSDKKDSDEVMKRQKECIIKLKKQGIPVETYLRISTPMHIIQSTCTTDDNVCGAVDSLGDGKKSKETECYQNVSSGIFETQGLDLSVNNAKFSASTVKDAIKNSASTVKDAMENSASMKHTTVRGAKCSIPVGNTTDIGTQHSPPTKDLAKSHEEISTEEMKEIDFSVKSAGFSTPVVCIPIRSIKCLKPQKDDIGKGTDYSSVEYNVQSSGHIIPNQFIDTCSTSCVTPQHSNTGRTAILSDNCTDTVKSLKGTNLECPLYSAYDRDISNRSAGCPMPDLDMSVKSGECLTSDMDMSVRSGECLTPDMDMSVKSGECLTPDMDMSVISSGYSTLEEDIYIVKNPKSVEYKTCDEFDSHFKCDPADTHNSKMSKPDMPKYFGVDSEVDRKNSMPQSGGLFGNKNLRDYGNSAVGEFLNNENGLSQIRRHYSGNAVAMLDSENISGQQDPHSSKSVDKSNRSLENRIMQLLRSDLIREFFKFSDDIAVYEDLQTFLHQNELQLPSNRLYHFSVNICTGLNYLHQQKILHRLLRAKSIYIDKKMVTKIGDLEWAQQADDISDQQVTLPDDYHRWMSPESLLHGKFSFHSDVWSFGLILWEIFNLGLEPFTNIEPDMLKMRLQEGLRPKKPHNCDIRLYRVMKTCWRYAGEDRPSIESILSQLSFLMKSQVPIANGEMFV